MELSKNHIRFTLGIPVPLNEYIQLSRELNLRILQEQLLYETFLDSIKNYASEKYNQVVTTIKDWKDAAVVVGKVLSDENLLNDFLKPLERRVNNLIIPLTDFLKKLNLDSFIVLIKKFLTKISSLEGWKKFMALVTIGTIITYIIEKLKLLGPEVVKDFLTKTFSSNFITDIVGKLTDFKSYLGWLQPIVKGVETIFNFLKPLIDAFSKAFQSGSKFATKLIKENNLTQFNMKERFQQLAGIKEKEVKSADVKSLVKLVDNNTTIKNKLQTVNNAQELQEFLEYILNTINPKISGVNVGKLKSIIDNRF
jgi:hypothetical protein